MFREMSVTELFCYSETIKILKLIDKLIDDIRERIVDLEQNRCSEFDEGYLECLRKEHNDLILLKDQINNK
jgi:hypothetical protein